MANKFRGEVEAEIDGKRYILVLDFNALAAFEEETGKEAMAVLAQMEGGSVSAVDLRRLVWAMLQRHHPDATLQDAGDILSSSLNVLERAVTAAMPKPGDDAEAGKAAPGKPMRARR